MSNILCFCHQRKMYSPLLFETKPEMMLGSTLGDSLPTASFTTGAGPGIMMGAAADKIEYIGTWTTCVSFCRRPFKMNFREWKLSYSIKSSPKFVPWCKVS